MVWIGEDCRIRLWWDSNQKVVKFVLIIGNSSTGTEKIVVSKYIGTSRSRSSVMRVRTSSMTALSLDFNSQTSIAMKDEALGTSECASDDEFVHIHLTSSEEDSAMASLSTILQSEKAIGSRSLEFSPAGSSEENPAITLARDSEVGRTTRYKNLKTTSTDPVSDIDPSKRETYLSEEEFGSLFGMSKSLFYALPKLRQA